MKLLLLVTVSLAELIQRCWDHLVTGSNLNIGRMWAIFHASIWLLKKPNKISNSMIKDDMTFLLADNQASSTQTTLRCRCSFIAHIIFCWNGSHSTTKVIRLLCSSILYGTPGKHQFDSQGIESHLGRTNTEKIYQCPKLANVFLGWMAAIEIKSHVVKRGQVLEWT